MEDKILVETSARHIHLNQESFDYLMGAKEGEHLEPTFKKALSQPGQYASDNRFTLVGEVNPKTGKPRMIANVSLLGPLRNLNQIEVSATDARTLGVNAPVRLSGDVKGSAPITVVNPENGREIHFDEGCIIAKRHIHMTPEDAEHFHVKDGDNVAVLVESEHRTLIFSDTIIRVSPSFSLAMHIDTDESNAVLASSPSYGTIIEFVDEECCCDGDCCK